MSRSRNLKPGFFKNDRLAECQPLARLLFQGLWCEADREGRLEDRAKRLKAECLPYDDCDIDELLCELEARGFIVRYTIGADRYILVVNFAKHQNPHVKEQASSIPAPDLPGASPVHDRNEHSSCPADSLLLIPDSPLPADAVGSFEGQTPEAEAAASAAAIRLVELVVRLRKAGCSDASASNAFLLTALKEGFSAEELQDAAGLYPGKPIKYLVAALRGQRMEASALVRLPPRPAETSVSGRSPAVPVTPESQAAAKAAHEEYIKQFGYST